jgi:hypothetical protein
MFAILAGGCAVLRADMSWARMPALIGRTSRSTQMDNDATPDRTGAL